MESLRNEFWRFVEANLGVNPDELRLRFHGKVVDGVDVPLAITQIECRRRFRKKLADTLEHDPLFLFPSTLAGEQATSDRLASIHVALAHGNGTVGAVVDLTAGLGIDLFHFQGCAGRIVGVEMDVERAEALRYNSARLCPEAEIVCGDCRDFLRDYDGPKFDVAFIDPARRADDGGRVFALSDCQPDVVSLLPAIAKVAKRLIVKMSPMLDISHTANELPGSALIAAVGTTTECKELVAVVDLDKEWPVKSISDRFDESIKGATKTPIEGGADEPLKISAITMTEDGAKRFDFTPEEEFAAEVEYGVPKIGDEIVEPYPAIMKAGCRKLFAVRYGLKKLSANSNVYFRQEDSGDVAESSDIQATAMKVVAVMPYASKVLKRFKREYPKVSISTRNFDLTPDQLRRKLGTADGGPYRLIATKDAASNPILILTQQ